VTLKTIGVIGGGAWGTALANIAARAGRKVVLWAREGEAVASINEAHENRLFLPGIRLESGLHATTDMAELEAADAILMVAPAQHMRGVATLAAPYFRPGVPAVICAKGIEQNSGALMSEVLAEVLPGKPLAVLSGPTFALEAALGLPTAVTLACASENLGLQLVAAIGLPTFRPYASTDLIGAQIGGAVKNVLAIASGIVVGHSLGENAKAALITRGLAEILRFGHYKGGETVTMMGLSGLGDLVLTCSGAQSRNMSLGIAIGQGKSLGEVLDSRTSVAEGVYTAEILARIAAEAALDMPICQAVAQVLHQGASVDAVIEGLLNRPFRAEI
jgi:glycerol-3-phosphate dehydrogenase (NAD(P)+)